MKMSSFSCIFNYLCHIWAYKSGMGSSKFKKTDCRRYVIVTLVMFNSNSVYRVGNYVQNLLNI